MPDLTELPPEGDLLKYRDRAPDRFVRAETYHCNACTQPGGEGAGTTVDWLGSIGPLDGPDGRCRECGQKYMLVGANESPDRCPFCASEDVAYEPAERGWLLTCRRCGHEGR